MNASWQTIVAPGILQSDDQPLTSWFSQSPYPDPQHPARIALTHLACLQLHGPDTVKFLQGQITQDARRIEQQTGFFTDFCNPKGRILASALVLPQAADQVLLLLPANNAEFLRHHLAKYLVFAKASLAPATDLFVLAHYQPGADFSPWQVSASEQHWQMAISDDLTLFVGQQDSAVQQWRAMDGQTAGDRFWQLLQLMQGRAWVDSHNRERYTPHQLNHQLIDAISFKKGCYTGQEVVARMHYKATLKSHLYAFELTGTQAPEPQQAVLDTEGAVGELVCCASLAADRWLLLADTRISALQQPLRLATPEGQILRPGRLPYAINNQD